MAGPWDGQSRTVQVEKPVVRRSPEGRPGARGQQRSVRPEWEPQALAGKESTGPLSPSPRGLPHTPRRRGAAGNGGLEHWWFETTFGGRRKEKL